MYDGRGIVFGILTFASRIGQYRGAQFVVRIGVCTAYAFVNHFLYAHLGIPLYIHAHFQEYGRNTGILTNRTMAFCTHTAIDQNLRHRIFGRRVFFFLISLVQSLNVVFRMVVADELESIENTLDKVFLLDDGHDCVPFRSHGREGLFIS